MSKSFIGIILGTFILVGGAFFLVLKWGSTLSPQPITGGPRTTAAPTPTPPPPPTVSVTVDNEKNANNVYIEWANLPDGTTELRIFRSPKGKNEWTLWKTINVTSTAGLAQFNVGKADYTQYSFYTEAVGNNNGGGNATSTLWTSTPIDPELGTPPPPPSPTPTPGGAPGSPTPAPSPAGPPSSSTPTPAPVAPSPSPVSGGGGNPTPTGTPYYNPQIQISGYGSEQTGNFWVQHVDQKIQIGWQNLPPIATSIIIYRSVNQDGPWSTVLTQENPGVNGSYSIQVVDDTLGQPFYYEMNAQAGSTTVATYGPVFLQPIGQ